MNVNNFPKNLKQIREFLGYSQAEVAELAGLTCGSLSMLESGKRTPSLPTLVKLLKALGVKFERLVK